MSKKIIIIKDFLKGAGLIGAALTDKLIHGKVYVPYISDLLEEKDLYQKI